MFYQRGYQRGLPYSAFLEDLESYIFKAQGGLDDLREWWKSTPSGAPLNMPPNSNWDDQHYLYNLVMASVTATYDQSVDLRARIWRTLFCGPCSNAWLKSPNDSHMEQPTNGNEDNVDDIYGLLLKWRLNIPLCSDVSAPPPCPGCGQPQDFYGDHALCCAKMGRYKRHNRVRDFFLSCFEDAGYSAIPEASIPNSQLRPADVLVDNYSRGFPTAFDVTISHALQPSCSLAGVEVGKSASAACENKLSMYLTACNAVHWRFVPLAMESTGAVSSEVNSTIAALSRTIGQKSSTDSAVVASSLWSRLASSLFTSVGQQLSMAYSRPAAQLSAAG